MKKESGERQLYKSDEARRYFLGRYEEILARWPSITGTVLERIRVPTSVGETVVLAFGPTTGEHRRASTVPGKPKAEIIYLHGAGHALLELAPVVVGFLDRED
jgi:hypothetical protein